MTHQNDQVYSDRSSIRELEKLFTFSSNDFRDIIADKTVHRIDVPSTYEFSSERLEYIENGTQTDFDDSTKTTDDPAKWVLNASAGDTLTIKTRQRIRYTPGYENDYGISWHLADTLPDGAEIIVEQGNGSNSFRAVYTNSGSRYELVRDSTVQTTEEFVNPVDLQQPQIDKARNTMYGVGSSTLYKFYLNEQFEPVLDKKAQVGDLDHLSVDNFNLSLKITIDCSNASSGAELHVGSMEAKVRGNATPINREKEFVKYGTGGSIDDTGFTPVLAMRTSTEKANVTAEIAQIGMVPTADMKVVAFAVRPDQTDATDFVTPEESNPENDVIEITENVTTPTDPVDGRQATVVSATAANKEKSGRSLETAFTPIYEDDVIVFLAKSKDTTGDSVDIIVKTLQEW